MSTDDLREPRQAAPRPDRRGDDGLQARPAGDGRRPRGGHAPAARARHGVRRQARRPRDDRGPRRLPDRGRPRHDGRDRLRDRAGLEHGRVPGVRQARCSRRSRQTRPEAVASLEDERVELVASLGENIVVVGAVRYEAGEGEVLDGYVHPPGEQDRRARAARRRTQELARQVAMHVSFAAPEWTTRDEVPAEAVEAERDIYASTGRGAVQAGGGT